MTSDRGGLLTAKTLINSPNPSDGYTALYELGRLDLTDESMVFETPVWHELFADEELQRARRRLNQYGCQVRSPKP